MNSEHESAAEPIAIIGLGCRFPQAENSAAFWRLLRDGIDAITEVPADRFDINAFYDPQPATPGKIVTRYGGFLEQVDKFDPFFFGISPREAAHMDPQQRLLMEVAWEAMEDAGHLPDKLMGSQTGVFVGMITNDYEDLQFRDLRSMNIYAATGGFRSVASGRLSYMLGLQGPSLTVDTACSSSLVAVHLARQSLQSRECSLALAAGVNLILQPEHSLGFSNARMLSPDGRCKFCDANATGFIRSEGVGVVVLKLLSQAVADGDHIYALIRGSAVNNDGRSSGFLMTPSQEGQEAVLRAAYRNAGVSPGDVHYVEAHGTGTSVGDPIEVKALGAVLAEGRPKDSPCLLGSAKTNIGHTEGAAGIAGLIKVALSLQHRTIAPNLHLHQHNPNIPWQHLPFIVQQKLSPWPDDSKPARAGVSSFGISGTNAHVVMEEAPQSSSVNQRPLADSNKAQMLALSGHNAEALKAMAERYHAFVRDEEESEITLADICYTANVKRAHHEHRLALAAHSKKELAEHLEAFLQGETRLGVSYGKAHGELPAQPQEPISRRKLVFVFPGQGAQWFGMGRKLLEQERVFRESLERCEQAMREFADWSLLDELTAPQSRSRLNEIDVIQPTLFALQVALAALWRSWGVEPDAVVGHSMGEVAASYVAGILSLEAATKIICRRSRLLKRLSGRGAMAVVELSLEEAERVLVGYDDRLSIAVSNSPASTVLSGEPGALEKVLERLRREDIFCRLIKVDVASHSPQMDSLRDDLLRALTGLRPAPAAIPVYSTVTGTIANGLEFDADYWVRNLRKPVLFSTATQRLLEDGHTVFIEISPNPILLPAIQQILRHLQRAGMVLPSMRHDEEELTVMLGSLGELYTSGETIEWSKLFPAGGHHVQLPTYAWQRERFWIEHKEVDGRNARRFFAQGKGEAQAHPLLDGYFKPALNSGMHFWEADLSLELFPYLNDHRVRESIVLPAAAYIEAALAAASKVFGAGPNIVEKMDFKKALFLSGDESQAIQIVVSVERPREASFQFFSLRPEAEGQQAAWTLHATGKVCPDQLSAGVSTGEHLSPEQIRERCRKVTAGADYYQSMQARGLHYGPGFQGVEQIWSQGQEALGQLRMPAMLESQASAYLIHPALLDSCFQVLAATLPGSEESPIAGQDTYLPVALDSLRLYGRPPVKTALWCYASLHSGGEREAETMTGDVFLLDEDGQVLMTARGLRLQRLEPGEESSAEQNLSDWLYQVQWQAKARSQDDPQRIASPSGQPGRWLIFADNKGVGSTLKSWLEARGEACALALTGAAYKRCEPEHYQINPAHLDDYRQLLNDGLVGDQLALRGIIHLWSLEVAPPEETTLTSLETAQLMQCGSTLHLIQALAETKSNNSPRLWLVTCKSQMAGDGASDLSLGQVPLWGLGRVIANEHPELRCTRVDLGDAKEPEELKALFEELWSDELEPEVALRGESRYVGRLVRYLPQPQQADSSEAAAGRKVRLAFNEKPYRLEVPTPGILDNLTLRLATRRAPGPGEVEVQVYATGLNFRDVMLALGVLPPVSGDGPVDLGWECAGKITAIGDGVDSFSLGDEVIAVAPPCFSAFSTTSAFLVVPKPAHLTFEEAATIPIVFLTAYYALHHLGRISKGEKVLIHAAAGGVGLAAVQIAQQVGAEIFATAGSPEKRAFLQALGIQHVFDSRSLDFAGEVLRLTDGKGVDLVLNSLAGEAIPKSLATLSSQGRFLELGKTDILQNTPLGLRLFQNNISFFAIDLAQMFMERAQVCGALFREVIQQFERGDFKPLPFHLFPINEVADAFRFLGQAKHIGKVVVSMENQEVLVEVPPESPSVFDPEATYLLTGGLGGLGLSMARWMIKQGARYLVLLGRSGVPPTTRAEEALNALREAGAQEVRVVKADVARPEEVSSVLDEVKRSLPPLKGIIHAAGILDDGLLLQSSLERFQSVMAPKVSGAWNLHQLTLDAPLDFFVLFSSVATLLGSPGQGNYSAANAFLDALAHYRHVHGQPALSINWGPWSEVGLAARPDRGGRLALRGISSLTPEQGVKAMESLMCYEAAQIGVMPFNFEQWAEFYTVAARSPFFAELARKEEGKSTGGSARAQRKESQIRDALLAVEPGRQRRALLESFLQEQVAHVLKLSPSRIDPHKPLGTFGLDSLMALEFRNRLEANLDQTFSATMVWNHPTIAALTSHVAAKIGIALERLAAEPAAGEKETTSPAAPLTDETNGQYLETLLGEIEELPDAEAQRMVSERLTTKQNSYE